MENPKLMFRIFFAIKAKFKGSLPIAKTKKQSKVTSVKKSSHSDNSIWRDIPFPIMDKNHQHAELWR